MCFCLYSDKNHLSAITPLLRPLTRTQAIFPLEYKRENTPKLPCFIIPLAQGTFPAQRPRLYWASRFQRTKQWGKSWVVKEVRRKISFSRFRDFDFDAMNCLCVPCGLRVRHPLPSPLPSRFFLFYSLTQRTQGTQRGKYFKKFFSHFLFVPLRETWRRIMALHFFSDLSA